MRLENAKNSQKSWSLKFPTMFTALEGDQKFVQDVRRQLDIRVPMSTEVPFKTYADAIMKMSAIWQQHTAPGLYITCANRIQASSALVQPNLRDQLINIRTAGDWEPVVGLGVF